MRQRLFLMFLIMGEWKIRSYMGISENWKVVVKKLAARVSRGNSVGEGDDCVGT